MAVHAHAYAHAHALSPDLQWEIVESDEWEDDLSRCRSIAVSTAANSSRASAETSASTSASSTPLSVLRRAQSQAGTQEAIESPEILVGGCALSRSMYVAQSALPCRSGGGTQLLAAKPARPSNHPAPSALSLSPASAPRVIQAASSGSVIASGNHALRRRLSCESAAPCSSERQVFAPASGKLLAGQLAKHSPSLSLFGWYQDRFFMLSTDKLEWWSDRTDYKFGNPPVGLLPLVAIADVHAITADGQIQITTEEQTPLRHPTQGTQGPLGKQIGRVAVAEARIFHFRLSLYTPDVSAFRHSRTFILRALTSYECNIWCRSLRAAVKAVDDQLLLASGGPSAATEMRQHMLAAMYGTAIATSVRKPFDKQRAAQQLAASSLQFWRRPVALEAILRSARGMKPPECRSVTERHDTTLQTTPLQGAEHVPTVPLRASNAPGFIADVRDAYSVEL
jgi:hypothetical protein